jgi:signal peptidase I
MLDFLFNRRLHHARALAEEVYRNLRRNRVYAQELLRAGDLEKIADLEKRYLELEKSRDADGLEKWAAEGEKAARKTFPVSSGDWIRENVEVFMVAIVVALAIRAYFLQPFKIPTDSMKPTLYGIQTVHKEGPAPSLPVRILEQVFLGRSYTYVKTKEGGVLHSMKPGRIGIWFEYTDLKIGNENHRVWSGSQALENLGVRLGRNYAPGEVVLNYVRDTGDQVFVDKVSYHFRKPSRGEVFVFKTTNIPYIENKNRWSGIEGSQYYIKRCVGVPSDTLRIEHPYLYVNGEIIREPKAFERVHSRQNGYHGYMNIKGTAFLSSPADTFSIESDRYWAMGDNSGNSEDSRFWGPVPRENLVGTGFFVYWPFTSRWGLIH